MTTVELSSDKVDALDLARETLYNLIGYAGASTVVLEFRYSDGAVRVGLINDQDNNNDDGISYFHEVTNV